MRWVRLALRLALGAVFIYAAYTKLSQPWLVFAMSIDSYGILPEWGVLAVARALPWFELILGIALASGFGLRYWALIATGLLVFFLAMMIRAYALGMGIDCGCFGAGEALSAKTLARDGALTAAGVFLTVSAFRARRSPVTESPASALPEPASPSSGPLPEA
jgi:uncharacterized membrane protein YphA (DoxX/SURF4 family)